MTDELLRPTNDLVFKLLLTREPEVLRYVLTAVLKPASPIAEAEVLNPKLPDNFADEKGAVLDVLVRLQDGTLVDIEMQCAAHPGLGRRLLFYWARAYASQLRRGQLHSELAPCKGIFFLDFTLDGSDRFHSIFRLREVETGLLLDEALELHTLELPRFKEAGGIAKPPGTSNDPDVALAHWLRFLRFDDPDEVERLARIDPMIDKAQKQLQRLSADPATRQLAADREAAEVLFHHSMAVSHREGREEGIAKGREEGIAKGREEGIAKGREEGREEGIAKGREEGLASGRVAKQREMLRLILTSRFDELPASIDARLEAAGEPELDAWLRSALQASTLDDVFG